MAATLAKFLAKTAECVVQVDPDDPETAITVWYRPNAVDFAFAERMQAAPPGEQVQLLAEYLSRLLAAWDLRRDDGDEEPLPVTAETVRELPLPVAYAIVERVNADLLPNRKTAT
jgi:hypothetical protein